MGEWVELNNGMRILKVRIPDSRPPEVRKMLGYANTLRELLKSDFLRYLKGWALSADEIEDLLCVMQRYPKYAINEQQMKWLEEYKESLSVVPDAKGEESLSDVPDAKGERSYSDGLLDLFHNNTNLIAELVGLSDDEIAIKINGWAKDKDKLGKPLIKNPKNGLRLCFARELKANGIIKQAVKTFRLKL